MRWLLAGVVVASYALLGAAAGAHSQSRSYSGHLDLWVKGWGRVLDGPEEPLTCNWVLCRVSEPLHSVLTARGRVVLVERPYPYTKGWKFSGWRGACKGKERKCVIDVARTHANARGEHNIHVGAVFVAVGPGLTRAHPVPLGTTAPIRNYHGVEVRVNSGLQQVQLSPAPPAGSEYVAANVTLTNNRSGSIQTYNGLGWSVKGRHNRRYLPGPPGFDECPSGGPQPQLPIGSSDRLSSGQSATGYVCWTIDTNDAGTLELFFGGGEVADNTTWFALH
jgi:hypothetical protein